MKTAAVVVVDASVWVSRLITSDVNYNASHLWMEASTNIAADLQIRAADAVYVAVAHQMNIPLISWDREQLRRASSLINT